jgi:co-chaperonin GroES (HSP10)
VVSIRTLGDRIAVELLPGVGKIGLLHIPDATKSTRNQTFCRATVTARGPDAALVNVGDTIVLSEYFGDEVEVDGKKLRIGRERDIVGLLCGTVFIPPDDRVLLERIEAPKMAGLIHLPEDRNQPQFKARVVATGPDCDIELSARTVLLQKHMSVEVHFEGKEYLLADEPSILTML